MKKIKSEDVIDLCKDCQSFYKKESILIIKHKDIIILTLLLF